MVNCIGEKDFLSCQGSSQMSRSAKTALEDNLANVVESLDMFIGGPWVRCDCADAVVGLAHDIEGQSPVLAEAKTFSRRVREFTG